MFVVWIARQFQLAMVASIVIAEDKRLLSRHVLIGIGQTVRVTLSHYVLAYVENRIINEMDFATYETFVTAPFVKCQARLADN